MKSNKSGAFTLIEILVAVAIFSLIIGVASSVFVLSIKAQRKTLSDREILSQVSYAMEYVSRAIRMARKDIDGNCTGGVAKSNFFKTATGVAFENYEGDCQEFYIESGRLKESKDGNVNFLTAPNLTVSHFNINDLGWDQTDRIQPRVTLFLEILGFEQSQIKIQTSISQRNLDYAR
ncbi:MAG: prepilin-type N-terminal cleavage/methylation domain-containing protein [Candidatus Nealsonbacteria bacterium]